MAPRSEEHPLAALARPFINVLFALAPVLIKIASAAHALYKKVSPSSTLSPAIVSSPRESIAAHRANLLYLRIGALFLRWLLSYSVRGSSVSVLDYTCLLSCTHCSNSSYALARIIETIQGGRPWRFANTLGCHQRSERRDPRQSGREQERRQGRSGRRARVCFSFSKSGFLLTLLSLLSRTFTGW